MADPTDAIFLILTNTVVVVVVVVVVMVVVKYRHPWLESRHPQFFFDRFLQGPPAQWAVNRAADLPRQ